MEWEYTCTLNPCTRRTCVIHGRPSSQEIDSRIRRRIRDHSHLQDLKGLRIGAPVTTISNDSEHIPSLSSMDRQFVRPAFDYALNYSSILDLTDGEVATYYENAIDYVFGSKKQRLRASQNRPLAGLDNNEYPPLVSTHGVQYKKDAYHESPRQSRRVIITGLSPDTKIYDIMARVRFGPVIQVSTATSPQPVGHTVVIEFVESEIAAVYAQYAGRNAAELFGEGAGVIYCNTPSYPLSKEMSNDISCGFTRLLVFTNFGNHCPMNLLYCFREVFRNPEEVLEDVWLDKDDVLFVLFKNLAHASLFYKIVMWREEILSMGAFLNESKNRWRFAPDPCTPPPPREGPPDLVVPARGPYPSMLEVWVKFTRIGSDVIFSSLGTSPISMPTDAEIAVALERILGRFDEYSDDFGTPEPSVSGFANYLGALDTPTMGRPNTPAFYGESLGGDLSDASTISDPAEPITPTHAGPAESCKDLLTQGACRDLMIDAVYPPLEADTSRTLCPHRLIWPRRNAVA
ncbi:hypothetical protein F5Y06DRAFT_307769 [Hypoxylon sp. FL0890]|nr:hypothetical protein F5Y06DRAFT_307769 [Hypoxylon sp. FL0890]